MKRFLLQGACVVASLAAVSACGGGGHANTVPGHVQVTLHNYVAKSAADYAHCVKVNAPYIVCEYFGALDTTTTKP